MNKGNPNIRVTSRKLVQKGREMTIPPTEFDAKLTELREIEHRMKLYNDKTPIAKVVADQERARFLYSQIESSIMAFKSTPATIDDGGHQQ